MILPFKYYLHDDYDGEEMIEWLSQQTGVEIDAQLVEKIGRPFYEVALNCILNTETGEVRILNMEQS